MKPFVILFIAALLAPAALRAELTIISTEHREPAYFKRLSEYFTGQENTGRYAVLRTDPAHREGFYISLKADDRLDRTQVAVVRLSLIRPGSQEIATTEIPLSGIAKRRFLVGLTETEWQMPSARPTAWSIELLDSTGHPLGSAQSFLWSK